MKASEGNITLASLMNISENRFVSYMSSIQTNDHETFRGMCEAYGLAHRATFLQLFLGQFVAIAESKELVELARAVSSRRAILRASKKRGRPKASEDAKILEKAVKIAFLKYVDCHRWNEVAQTIGLRTDNAEDLKKHITTMKRQLAALAEKIFGSETDDLEESIETIRKSDFLKVLLQTDTGMPFDRSPIACEIVMFGLAIDKLKRVSRGAI
jgi:hypothetical protein